MSRKVIFFSFSKKEKKCNKLENLWTNATYVSRPQEVGRHLNQESEIPKQAGLQKASETEGTTQAEQFSR